MPYPIFDRSRLKLKPLAERVHDMTLADVLPLDAPPPPFDDANLSQVAHRIVQARQAGAPVILMMGAHVVKRGLSRFVVDLMERQIITHVAMNDAGAILVASITIQQIDATGVASRRQVRERFAEFTS